MFAALADSSGEARELFHRCSKIISSSQVISQALLDHAVHRHSSLLLIPFATSSRVCHGSLFFLNFPFAPLLHFLAIRRSLLHQTGPLLFLSLPSGSPGVAAAAQRSSVLPAADAAAADQQRSAAEPGRCATGKGASTVFFLTLEFF